MTSPSKVDSLCRLTVVTDSGSTDVALPAGVPIGELLPALVGRIGAEGAIPAAMVVQRWGEEPLDEERTPAALGLLDGETLFLRARHEAIPPAEFDDLIESISATTGLPVSRWRAANTVTLVRVAAGVLLALAAVSLLLPGPSLARQIAALVATAVTLALAVAAVRALRDPVAGLVLMAAAVGYGGLGGALVQAGERAAAEPLGSWLLTPSAALAGGVGVMIVSLLLLAVLADRLALLVPAALAGGLLAVFGIVALFTGAGTTGSAALVLVLSLVFTVAAPMAAFRLARLQLPPLPDEIEDIELGIDPLPAREVVPQITLADRCATGLLHALSAMSMLMATMLVAEPGWSVGVLISLGAALQLVRTRLLRGVVQRLAILVSGLYLAALTLLRHLGALPPVLAVGLAVGAFLAVAVAMLASAVWISERILPPYWGRAAEIVEWLTCAALLPIAAVSFGLYGWARGLGG